MSSLDDLQSVDLRIRTTHMRLDVDWFRAMQQIHLPNQDWHTHRNPEIHFLLEGEVRYLFRDGEILLHGGEALIIPAQTAHCLRVDGGAPYYRYVMMASLETLDEDPEAMLFARFFALGSPRVAPIGPEMESCLQSSMREAAAREMGFRTVLEGHVLRILILLMRSVLPLEISYPVREKKALNLERMQQMERIVEEEMDISLQQVAQRLYLSPRQVQRIIREQRGMSFQQLAAAVRIRRAKELLQTRGLSVSEVAERVGFQSSQSFIRFFRQQENQTPAQYRASSQSGGNP